VLEVHANDLVGCDPVPALRTDRIEARAHCFEVDLLAMDHAINVAQGYGEHKAKMLICFAWTKAASA
jgi:hypothetical protein